jgi:hypothetical protein
MKIILITLASASFVAIGLFLGASFAWLSNSSPNHKIVKISVPVEDSLEYNPDLEYFYETTLQYTYKRGPFPFFITDTILIEKELKFRHKIK